MSRPRVDLNGAFRVTDPEHPADFPVGLKTLCYRADRAFVEIPHRRAVVRKDTGEPLAVVSDRYTLVPHGRLLSLADEATKNLDVGRVEQGIYLDRNGTRLRALFKFPDLARPIRGQDEVCPCLKVVNTYDGTAKIAAHIGAFRFVCTNLAVGGGGAFAGGFMAVHQGEIPLEEIVKHLRHFLGGFETIVGTYRAWSETSLDQDRFAEIVEPLPKRTALGIQEALGRSRERTVFAGYNAGTWYATHGMRSAASAFRLLKHLNRAFQETFPPSPN